MPRLRNRVRRRVAAPIEEPAEDEETEPEDEADQEQAEAELGQPDPTVRALQEDAYQRRIGNSGELGDIAPSEISDLSQQVTTGSAASVNIADQFDPGFTRTEIVNRLGMVLSLSFSYDYGAGEWVPDPIDRTESQAIEQQLAEDRATDNVEDVVDPGEGTVTNSDGDLQLRDQQETTADLSPEDSTSSTGAGINCMTVVAGGGSNTVTGTIDSKDATQFKGIAASDYGGDRSRLEPVSYPDFELSYDEPAGAEVEVWLYDHDETGWEYGIHQNVNVPINTEFGDVYGYQGTTSSDDIIRGVKGIENTPPADEGTATSTFDNPCTASSVRSAQYDVCSRSKDVTIDLFEGDPDDPDSILLRDDIDQREDIVDIPDSRTDLQYRITIERGPDGETPKVSRLGHQLIR